VRVKLGARNWIYPHVETNWNDFCLKGLFLEQAISFPFSIFGIAVWPLLANPDISSL
jgi:hypothetical protein